MSGPVLLPDDPDDRTLAALVHPTDWVNPTPGGRYHLVVLGAGTAGLVTAAAAAGLGARVALVERALMGGDCLNVGCVPSKGLLRAAHATADARGAAAFGVRTGEVTPDFAAAMRRVRGLRAALAPTDSAERFRGLGVDVFFGSARFVGPDAVEVDGRRLEFRRAVIATGGRATGLPVPGLAEAGFLTNENVFTLTTPPARLIVIGAGPIGCELAQAFVRLGVAVTMVSLDPRLVPREDPDAASVLAARFAREGIVTALGARLVRVERRGEARAVLFDRGRGVEEVVGDQLLVAVGRAPNVEDLDLDRAGVRHAPAGVVVDDRLRTTNPRIYAAGDVCSAYKFTHAADAMARIVVQNALFLGRRKASALVIPWCTYTDPEIAHVGITAEEAAARGDAVVTLTQPFAEVDRARLDGETDGFARVHVATRGGKLLGATLVARHAGETIGEIALAMTHGLGIGALGSTVHPYPTQAEALRKLGDAYRRRALTPFARRLFGAWFRLWR